MLHDALSPVAAVQTELEFTAPAETIDVCLVPDPARRVERTPESAEIRAWFEQYQQKLRTEARDEGLNEGERRLLLRQLRARFGELPAAVVDRVEEAGVDEIERWGERVLGAQSLGEVLDEPS